MPAGYDEDEALRRARDREMRASNADGRSRGYRGSHRPGSNPYGANYVGYDYTGGSTDPNIGDADEALEGVPILGWLSGADARAGAARAEAEARNQRNMMLALGRSAPTAEELTPEYYLEDTEDAYGDMLGGSSAMHGVSQGRQQEALGQIGRAQSALGELMRGGMTQADRQALTAQRLRQGQQLRGANDAAMQQMSARGMGGGGAELAARLGGSQAYANASAMGDASILGQSQNRALQAMQGYGQLGSAYGGVAGQMAGQDLQRRAALDSYSQQNLDWRRGRETRNTAWGNRQQDSRMNARQQAYENQERAVAAAAGYNPYGAGAADRARQDAANEDLASGIGGIIEGIL